MTISIQHTGKSVDNRERLISKIDVIRQYIVMVSIALQRQVIKLCAVCNLIRVTFAAVTICKRFGGASIPCVRLCIGCHAQHRYT